MNRRQVMQRAMALGLVSGLEGCNYDDPNHPDLADKFLHAMSAWNDRVQAALFDPHTLAPTFRPSQITMPPRFNAFYDISQAPVVDETSYRLELGGQIADKTPWSLAQLNALPQEGQITRLICVEGWRVIGQWAGVPLGQFLRRVGADTNLPLCVVPMRRRVLFFHRHGIRAASADAAGTAVSGAAPHPGLWRAGAAADSHKAWLQEPEIHHAAGGNEYISGRLLGGPGL